MHQPTARHSRAARLACTSGENPTGRRGSDLGAQSELMTPPSATACAAGADAWTATAPAAATAATATAAAASSTRHLGRLIAIVAMSTSAKGTTARA
jgi:hypothetical protein